MDIYAQKANWKIVLGVVGAILLLFTIYFSNDLANSLKENEEKQALWYMEAVNKLHEQGVDPNKEIDGIYSNLIIDVRVRVITENEDGELDGFRWGEAKDTNAVFLAKKKEEFLADGLEPLQGAGYSKVVYYFPSELHTRITYFPIVQMLLVSLFIALGYYLFSTARRAEQSRVWAGMAKETAHQLGTPISAIIGWIEHLKLENEDRPEQQEIITELRSDVTRLELIADRFSKIGSEPELSPIRLVDQLRSCEDYMERRSPKRVSFHLHDKMENEAQVKINQHLFDWVVENLYRNALDAMDGEGKITTTLYSENEYVCIDISDTGSGIASSKLKTVFQPGYSTKQRGWGLGLSLAKRIIEDYHKGKIYVKNSKINEGTTFTIKLPTA